MNNPPRLTIDVVATDFNLERQKCLACRKVMRFVGLEPHPATHRFDVLTYECGCGESQVQTIARH